MNKTSTNTKIFRATKAQVYNAFTSKEALEFWLAPNGMTGKIHSFDLKVGGGYEMSLYYKDESIEGKTSGNEDRSVSRFTELVPNERIVQSIKFSSDKDEFGNEMIMEVSLEAQGSDSTKVTVVFKNIPDGIKPEDNEQGTAESLEKLGKYLKS